MRARRVRNVLLADLLGAVMAQIQIPSKIADWIAAGVRESQSDLEIARQQSLTQLTQRRRAVQAKLDRGYDDYLEGRISEVFWRRKSEEAESRSYATTAIGSLTSCWMRLVFTQANRRPTPERGGRPDL